MLPSWGRATLRHRHSEHDDFLQHIRVFCVIAKKPQEMHSLATDSPKPRIVHNLGYVAQNAILKAPRPPATPHFLWFSPLGLAQTDAWTPVPVPTRRRQAASSNPSRWVPKMGQQGPPGARAVLNGKKKSVPVPVFQKKARGHSMCSTMVGGGWRLAVGGWRLAVGNWRLVAVGSGWQLLVGRRWRLVAVGSWRLVAVGGWQLVAVGG